MVKKTIEEKWKAYTTEIRENVSYIFLHVLYLLIMKERKQIERTYKPPFFMKKPIKFKFNNNKLFGGVSVLSLL